MINNFSPQGKQCIICGSSCITPIIEINNVPVSCNTLWFTKHDAINAPLGDIHLGICQNCGHIFNLLYNPDLVQYNQEYENSLHFSQRFQEYARDLAGYLIVNYDLYNKHIIDIGCGQGEFLKLLCTMGNNHGLGFDPAYNPSLDNELSKHNITIIQEYYTDKNSQLTVDLICCRHVLEHLDFPLKLLRTILCTIGKQSNPILFFEVPNVLSIIKSLSIWDIIYEHRSYFSPASLHYIFRKLGYLIINLNEVYGGQYLSIEAMMNNSSQPANKVPEPNLEKLISLSSSFSGKYLERINHWIEILSHISKSGSQVVVWGAGSKGVSFVNLFREYKVINYVVDINPRKHGKYIAGTGHYIVSPDSLRHNPPDVIIVMNKIYKDEILTVTKQSEINSEILYV